MRLFGEPGRKFARPERLLAVLCWGVVAAIFLLPISNPDLFWHLSAARFIVSFRKLPQTDWLSWTLEGKPWTDFEWLSQLIWYAVLKSSGMWGLVVLKASLFCGGAWGLWRTLRLYRIGSGGSAVALLAWAVALVPAQDLRPENFSIFLFSLEWFLLEKRRLRREAADPDRLNWKEISWIALGAAAWTNLHPGYVYGFSLLGVYALLEIWRHRSWTLVRLLVLCAGATLLNPYGIGMHRVLLTHMRDLEPLHEYINEWMEASIFNPWQWAFWGVLLASFLALLGSFLQNHGAPLEHMILLPVLALSASTYVRTLPYFVLVAIPVSAFHSARLRWGRREGIKPVLLTACWGALLGFFCLKLAPELGRRRAFIPQFVPEHIAQYLQSERAVLGGRKIYNPWAWGGYLGYQLSPSYRVFQDGRYIFHPFLRVVEKATRNPENHKKFLDGYGIDVVLASRTNQFFTMPVYPKGGGKVKLLRPYYLDFLPQVEWALIYWGPQGQIFVRRKRFPQRWVREREFRIFRPDDLRAAQLLVMEGYVPAVRLREEVERYIRLQPGLPEEKSLRLWLKKIASKN
ncbi:MAG: hypothetical protein HY551_08355 [Elusimicrobia bacterium]|nr:hypothetical protein [Elusimicrobiota bacterium]